MGRWSDLATWRGPSPHITPDGMRRYDGMVVHIAVGYFEGTISWQRTPRTTRRSSSHFVTGREPGQLAQIVDTDDAAWTQGDGNGEWISVENAGFNVGHPLYEPGWELLTPWQIEANAQLFARGHLEFGWPLQLTNHPDRPGLGYHGMGAENGRNWGHLHCPGEPIKAQLPAILARAIEIVGGAMSEQTAIDILWMAGRIEAMARLYDTYQYGPEAGKEVPFTKAIKLIAASAGVDADELAAITAAAHEGAETGIVAAAGKLADAVAVRLGAGEEPLTIDGVKAAVAHVLTHGTAAAQQ